MDAVVHPNLNRPFAVTFWGLRGAELEKLPCFLKASLPPKFQTDEFIHVIVLKI